VIPAPGSSPFLLYVLNVSTPFESSSDHSNKFTFKIGLDQLLSQVTIDPIQLQGLANLEAQMAVRFQLDDARFNSICQRERILEQTLEAKLGYPSGTFDQGPYVYNSASASPRI
jgi:hypothetical protein